MSTALGELLLLNVQKHSSPMPSRAAMIVLRGLAAAAPALYAARVRRETVAAAIRLWSELQRRQSAAAATASIMLSGNKGLGEGSGVALLQQQQQQQQQHLKQQRGASLPLHALNTISASWQRAAADSLTQYCAMLSLLAGAMHEQRR